MTDFLTRLIQRADNRLPVARPLIRSSYTTAPVVNETVSEFETTVSFGEEAEPVSLGKGVSAGSPDTAIDSGTNVPVAGENAVSQTADTRNPLSDLSGGETFSPPEVRLEVEDTQSRNRGRVQRQRTGDREEMAIPNIESNRKGSTTQEPQGISEAKTPVRRDVTRRQTIRNITAGETEELVPQSAIEIREDSGEIARSEGIRKSEIAQTPVTRLEIEKPEPTEPETLVPWQYRSETVTRRQTGEGNSRRTDRGPVTAESSSSPNIKVTIGRIEVRAVNQPEAAVSPATPKGPAISLDAYLKSRSEEGR